MIIALMAVAGLLEVSIIIALCAVIHHKRSIPTHQLGPGYIYLTRAEVLSKHDRVRWAENLIKQLPVTHEGRNSWLLNYGRGEEARTLRYKHSNYRCAWDEHYQANTLKGD